MSGIFGASQLFFSGAGDFYDFPISNSLRFDRASSANLERTPSSEGNRQTHTISMWVKRVELGRTTRLFGATNNSSNATFHFLEFNSDDTIRYYAGTEGSSAVLNVQTNAVYRDVSAWYHIVAALDTTQATSSNRAKLYVNGTQITDLKNSTYGGQNNNYRINDNIVHYINKDGSSLGNKFSGYYIAEVNFIDGQQLNPDSFGETKSGVWIPKEYSGTYGSNGFRLAFGDDSNIGDDTSVNGNDWTANNLSAHDVVPDSPTLNYATLNPIANGKGSAGSWTVGTLSEGNLKYNTMGSGLNTGRSTFQLKGKVYFETLVQSRSGSSIYSPWIGVSDIGNDYYIIVNASNNGNVSETGEGIVQNSGFTYTVGDIIGVEFDEANNTIKWYKNGTLGLTRSPQNFNFSDFDLFTHYNDNNPAVSFNVVANFGQDSTFAGNKLTGSANATDSNGYGEFYYTPSTDFLALNSANIVEPSITPLNDDLPEDYFESNLWTGNGTSQSISSYQFSPDWVWIKERTSTSSHYIVDTIRGTDVFIQSNSTVANTSSTVNLTSFDSNGFSLGSGGTTNQSSQTYVGWAWLAGGTAVSNTNGSITSTVSANQEAGFSIVKYTGTGSNATVGHGLSSAPDMVIHKRIETDGTNWPVFHKDIVNTKFVNLNTTAKETDSTSMFNSTSPTATVFSIGTSTHTNTIAKDYIAYCFHGVEGYSKIGSYKGNGSDDGVFIYTGFRPAYVLIKQSSAAGNNWNVHDNKRDVDNPVSARLLASTDDDETSFTALDFLSNGFKSRASGGAYNGDGSTYIYMAFAEMPFKYANAR